MTEPEPKKIAPKPTSAIDQLFAAAGKLSHKERTELAEAGFVVPNAASGSITDRIYGYRCHYCARVALEFVGTRFPNGDEEPSSVPLAGTPIDAIPWVQPASPRTVNRNRPVCQYCFNPIKLINRGLDAKTVIVIADFIATMDKQREAMRKRAREPAGSFNAVNPDGTTVAIPQNYDKTSGKMSAGPSEGAKDGLGRPLAGPYTQEYQQAAATVGNALQKELMGQLGRGSPE